jgi:hypothetical protein
VRLAWWLGPAASAAVAMGCATTVRTRNLPASIIRAARLETAHAGAAAAAPPEGAGFVVEALRAAGLRFGTDGSATALYGYLRTSHRLVPPGQAHPGDVVFFDVRGLGPQPACADHAGIVERVERGGRITFVEARAGQIRRSFVDPDRPTLRRDQRGQVRNSFLRPKTPGDPAGARYFAGQMLCAVARVTHR